LQHTPETVEAWVSELRRRFGQRPIAVAVEQTRGALVFMLSKYESLHIYPVPPAMTSHMRKAFYSSGAKDDEKDADLLLEVLQLHRHRLRCLSPDSEETRLLQNLVEERRKLVDEKTAQSNRLEAYLKVYFPQMLQWFSDLDSDLVCDWLERWPTLPELQRARANTLRSFFRQHRCHKQELIEGRIAAIAQAMPATNDQALIRAKVEALKVTVRLIRILRQGIRVLDRQIEEAAAAHPDFFIFDSLPGAGAVLAPRLLAALGTKRDRWENADQLQQMAGIAPVKESSGKSEWIHFRFACPKFLRQTFHEWAGHSIMYSVWARAYYQQQCARGKAHHAAVRALAFKWIRILFRCWKQRVTYSESTYLAALAKRNSPLVKTLSLAVA